MTVDYYLNIICTTKEFLLINNKVITPHETALYKAGYLDGLQAAIVAASENSSDHSYTIDLDDIF